MKETLFSEPRPRLPPGKRPHKLLQVMYLSEDTRRLDGRVEVDDAYLGGRLLGGKRD